MTTAIILAGGMGTRLRTVMPDVPKPMAPVNGRPFLEHQLDYWIDQGIDKFIVSVGYKKEVIMDHFGTCYRDTPLTYAIEEQPLGTGGGLLLATQGLAEPFLVLNGDTFFEVDLTALLKFHDKHHSEWSFSLFRANESGRYMGMDVTSDGEIVSLKSGTDEIGRLANGGVYLINPSVPIRSGFLPGHNFSLEDDFIPAFLGQGGKLYGLECTGTFLDIGVPQDYFRADDILPYRRKGQSMPIAAVLKKNLIASIEAKRRFLCLDDQHGVFDAAAREVVARYRRGGRLYVAGNGGSAADAQHLAAEFVSKLARDRAPLAAEALTVDTSVLTAIGNDYGYEQVFARQVAGKMTEKDIFLAITTSGQSPSILTALDVCRQMSIPTIVFAGCNGGLAKDKADYCIVVPGEMTSTIQEIHIVLAHSLCECVEQAIFNN